MRAYLYRIASNLAIDLLRRRGRAARHVAEEPLAADVPAAAPGADTITLRHDMARTFRELTPRHRVLLWLAYVEGSTHAEIARSLGLSPRSVPVLLFRARRHLARLLKGKGWEG